MNVRVHIIATGSVPLSIGIGIRSGGEEFERGVGEVTLLPPRREDIETVDPGLRLGSNGPIVGVQGRGEEAEPLQVRE